MSSEVEIHLGADVPERYVTIDGKPFDRISEITVEHDAAGDLITRMVCDLDEPFRLKGRMFPTEGLPSEPVDIEIYMSGRYTDCRINEHALRTKHLRVHADAASLTQIEIEYYADSLDYQPTRIDADYDPSRVEVIKGHLIPNI